GTQLGVVVDGAVEDHRQAQVAIDHRLPRGFAQVHDLQAAVPESNWAGAMEATGVGAAGSEVVGYFFNSSQVGRLIIESQFSSYSAHGPYRFSVGVCVAAPGETPF